MLGCPPGRLGICTGSFPLGWTRPERTPAIADALLSGHERLHQAGGAAVHVAEGIGAAGDHHHDHRRSGLEELVQQVGLHPGEPQVLGVAAFAGRPVAEQSGEVADHGHAEVGLAGGGERGSKPDRSAARTGQPWWWTTSTPGSSAATASTTVRTSSPSPTRWRGSTWLGKA